MMMGLFCTEIVSELVPWATFFPFLSRNENSEKKWVDTILCVLLRALLYRKDT